MERRIVCAANRRKNGEIVLGVRHFCMHMRNAIHQHILADDALQGYEGAETSTTDWSQSEQGFICNKGDFHTREEAWKIAEKTNQIVRRVGGDTMNGGRLFSENLY